MSLLSLITIAVAGGQVTPANIETFVKILDGHNARMGRSSHFGAPSISTLDESGKLYQARFSGQSGWVSLALHPGEKLKSFSFYDTSSKLPSFAPFDAPTLAIELARELGWLGLDDAAETIISSGPNERTVLVHRKVNGMLEYRPAALVFATDGGLIRGDFPADLKKAQYNIEAPRLGAEICLAKALEYYAAHKPQDSAEILSRNLYFGLPPDSVSHPEPELSEAQKVDFHSGRPFPFYMFVLAHSEFGESQWMQWIAVDARDGSLVSFSDFGGGFVPKGKAHTAPRPVLDKTIIGRVTGAVTPIGKLSAHPPSGRQLLVRSGNGVWNGTVSRTGEMWLAIGSTGWQRYRLDKKLLKTVKPGH